MKNATSDAGTSPVTTLTDYLAWGFLAENMRQPAPVEDDPCHYGSSCISSDETPTGEEA